MFVAQIKPRERHSNPTRRQTVATKSLKASVSRRKNKIPQMHQNPKNGAWIEQEESVQSERSGEYLKQVAL